MRDHEFFLCGVVPRLANEIKRVYFDNPPLNDVLCAEDVLAARLDRDAFGRVHPEIRYAVLLQIVRSVARDQIGANSDVKSLCEAGLTVCDEK
jgi:hypothetical protein